MDDPNRNDSDFLIPSLMELDLFPGWHALSAPELDPVQLLFGNLPLATGLPPQLADLLGKPRIEVRKKGNKKWKRECNDLDMIWLESRKEGVLFDVPEDAFGELKVYSTHQSSRRLVEHSAASAMLQEGLREQERVNGQITVSLKNERGKNQFKLSTSKSNGRDPTLCVIVSVKDGRVAAISPVLAIYRHQKEFPASLDRSVREAFRVLLEEAQKSGANVLSVPEVSEHSSNSVTKGFPQQMLMHWRDEEGEKRFLLPPNCEVSFTRLDNVSEEQLAAVGVETIDRERKRVKLSKGGADVGLAVRKAFSRERLRAGRWVRIWRDPDGHLWATNWRSRCGWVLVCKTPIAAPVLSNDVHWPFIQVFAEDIPTERCVVVVMFGYVHLNGPAEPPQFVDVLWRRVMSDVSLSGLSYYLLHSPDLLSEYASFAIEMGMDKFFALYMHMLCKEATDEGMLQLHLDNLLVSALCHDRWHMAGLLLALGAAIDKSNMVYVVDHPVAILVLAKFGYAEELKTITAESGRSCGYILRTELGCSLMEVSLFC